MTVMGHTIGSGALPTNAAPVPCDALLPVLYDELRKLAAAKLAREDPGHTLQPTALVHEVYLRLMGGESCSTWENRQHFFAAAADAMRQILIERARRKATAKRGGDYRRLEFEDRLFVEDGRSAQLLALDEALSELEQHDPRAAQIVKLRYFAGLSHQEAAEIMGISRRTADRLWSLAKTWLFHKLASD